jgi:2-amino-4-hydroxy-6-hydroxymethyldihydropteridine diphosphokinase
MAFRQIAPTASRVLKLLLIHARIYRFSFDGPLMILIAFGSNLPSSAGSPFRTLKAALAALRANGIEPVKVSRFYKNPAWPNPDDPPFLNAVAQVETRLAPPALLERLHEVERSFGRTRGVLNAPRTLDLDILDYDGRIETGPPQLPHPRMTDRAFVLVPLAEIAPDWHHSVNGQSVGALLATLPNGGSSTVVACEATFLGT